jgi:antitoxin (DNA-binding transcriptional repressor) of toxin-antitoxin stability system
VKEAKISELKDQLSRYLALVRGGEVVRILDRDVPIAQIVPITMPVGEGPVGVDALAALERKGIIRRGTGRIPLEILDGEQAGPSDGVLDALLEERRLR